MVRVALLVRLEAKPGKEADLAAFLRQGRGVVENEPGTPYWYAWQMGPSTFGIFDAFADDAGRDAHLAGDVARALMEQAPELLAEPPTIEKVELLSTHLRPGIAEDGVRVGLVARLEAKPDKADTVADFLPQARAIVEDEPDTLQWFALRFGPSSFGVFDVFPSDAGRQAHLSGGVASALMERADELFKSPPAIDSIDILASKLAH